MSQTIRVLVLGAVPPLSRSRSSDRQLGIERWLVLAYPDMVRARMNGAPR